MTDGLNGSSLEKANAALACLEEGGGTLAGAASECVCVRVGVLGEFRKCCLLIIGLRARKLLRVKAE